MKLCGLSDLQSGQDMKTFNLYNLREGIRSFFEIKEVLESS